MRELRANFFTWTSSRIFHYHGKVGWSLQQCPFPWSELQEFYTVNFIYNSTSSFYSANFLTLRLKKNWNCTSCRRWPISIFIKQLKSWLLVWVSLEFPVYYDEWYCINKFYNVQNWARSDAQLCWSLTCCSIDMIDIANDIVLVAMVISFESYPAHNNFYEL